MLFKHTHACTHYTHIQCLCTYAYMHAHTYMHAYACKHACTQMRAQIHTYTNVHAKYCLCINFNISPVAATVREWIAKRKKMKIHHTGTPLAA